jgi:hypothetical protein
MMRHRLQIVGLGLAAGDFQRGLSQFSISKQSEELKWANYDIVWGWRFLWSAQV